VARRRTLTPAELKTFRHNVAILNKKGVLSGTDARKAKPFWVRQGKRLDKLVESYDDVTSGKAEAVKVDAKQLRQYKKSGYETRKGRVIIPHAATERVSVTPKGHIKVKESKSGIKRIEIPIPFHNLEQWVRDGKKQGEQLDSLKGGRPYWAYKFHGHNSYATYTRLDILFDELSVGTASGLNLMDMAEQSTRKQQNEIYQNLTLFAVPSRDAWAHRNISERSATTSASRKRRRKRIKNTELGVRARARDNEAHKQWRLKLKGSKLNEYKRKAKARAKKSRKNKK
jgi:hypothetical protein